MFLSIIPIENSVTLNLKNSLTFKAHPDFVKLSKNYNITASSYFRRGQTYGSADKDFMDIVKLFDKIFTRKIKEPLKMLIAGIGESQEPFSYLAVIKNIIRNKNIKEVLDLHVVDLQSKPNSGELFKNSYFEYSHKPDYASSSFVKDMMPKVRFDSIPGYYRVNDEIFKFLDATYSNTEKSHWENRVQDSVKEHPNEVFDIISINNTLGYIADKQERIDTLKDTYRILKKDGFLISDPDGFFVKEAGLVDKFKEIFPGIYKK